jgi:hypothetical protein
VESVVLSRRGVVDVLDAGAGITIASTSRLACTTILTNTFTVTPVGEVPHSE